MSFSRVIERAGVRLARRQVRAALGMFSAAARETWPFLSIKERSRGDHGHIEISGPRLRQLTETDPRLRYFLSYSKGSKQ